MKKYWILALLIMMMAPVALAAEPVLKASIVKYDPLPAQPGEYVTVYIRLENIGNDPTTDAVLQVIPEYPFSIDPSIATKDIGIIGAQKDYVTDFKVRVNDNTLPGTSKLKVRFTTDKQLDIWTETELSIKIEGLGSDIQISSVTTNPQELVPGEEGTLRIRVRNDAGNTIRDIKFNLNLDDTTTTTYPFIPLGTATQQRIPKLEPGESSEFIYTIQPYPDAASQLYKIPVTMTYNDVQDNSYTKTDLIGIVVNSQPELMVTADDYRADGTLIVKVTNKGLSNVKFLTLYMEPSESYTLDSQSNSYYVGELQSDDFDTTDFQISFRGAEADIPVRITYRDANNNAYEETYTLNVKNGLLNTENSGTGAGTIIIIVMVVVIAGFVIWRVARRKK